MNTTPSLLTPLEAAHLLALRTRQVERLAAAGEIPHIRLPGGEVRFSEPDLLAWVNGLRQETEVPTDE